MEHFDRELELGFEVSAAQAIKIITRDNLVITHQDIIHQTWLEEGVVGDYKFRTRIRKVESSRLDRTFIQSRKYEFTTKYSKNNGAAVKQDNIELNTRITLDEYERLKKIYEAAGKEEVVKIRSYFRSQSDPFTIYTLDTYPDEEGDRARIEIEFLTEGEMKRWKAPDWLKELIDNKKA